MQKIRQIYNDHNNTVIVHQTLSNGMCIVTEIDLTTKEKGDTYHIHKHLLEVPNFLKPNPRRIQFVDPLDHMKGEGKTFHVATLQHYKPSYLYRRSN
jgi:hypothetical protein